MNRREGNMDSSRSEFIAELVRHFADLRDSRSKMPSNPQSQVHLASFYGIRDGQSSDATADANRRSEPVGCCRSACHVCIQETVRDGSSRAALKGILVKDLMELLGRVRVLQ
jgi:hypothetical protein